VSPAYSRGTSDQLIGVGAALDLRLRQAHQAQLEGTHCRVPAHLFDPVGAELGGELATKDDTEHHDIGNRDGEEPPQHEQADVLHLGLREEGEDDDAEHERNEQLTDTEARVDVVADIALLRAAVACRKVALVAVRHADPGLLALELHLGAGGAASCCSVARHEGLLACSLLLLAGGGRVPLAGRGGLDDRLGCLGHGGFLWVGSFKITRMTENAQAHPLLEQLREAVRGGMPVAISDLGRLVRIPSVSWDGFDPEHVLASATAAKELLEGLAVFDSVEIARAPIDTQHLGQPAVLATRAAKNGKPTILLYAHHDVQPPGSSDEWESDPFEPTVRGDRLYGRGSADDKAGVMAHVGAIRAFVETVGADFDLGLVAFFEGEEEFGSRSFANFIVENREKLAADVIVVADSDNWDVDTPALTVGLRGNVTFKLKVSTLDHASHSGMFGGAAPDAMLATIRLLNTLWNADGSVAVAGLTSREGSVLDYDEHRLAEEAAFLEGVKPIGRGPVLSRLWDQPAITVTGIDAPSVVNASNTLAASITVRVSARIAPGQSAAEAFTALEAHLLAHAPFGAHLEISDVDRGDPFLVDTTGWAVAEAKDAMHQAWGVAALETGVGGSIPFIADLVEVFPSAQILVTGVEDPDSRAHSPNESLHLGVFQRAILTEALLLAKLEARA
jgi:cysteinylglycine-S-conjugate dipeptidase